MRKITRPSPAVKKVEEDEGDASKPRCPQRRDDISDDRGRLRFTVGISKHSRTDEDFLERCDVGVMTVQWLLEG
jgi:hypothetical protein